MDSGEFDALYTEHSRALFNTVYRWLWHVEDSEDVVHEAFARFWENRFDESISNRKAYLFRMALNLASKRKRWLRIRHFFDLKKVELYVSDAEETLLGRERALHINRAIERLPEKQKSVLLMIRFAEMSYSEVAQVLGISEGTVASRLHHAIKALKEALP